MLNTDRIDSIQAELESYHKRFHERFEVLVADVSTPSIESIMNRFQKVDLKKLDSELEHAIDVLRSPVYVGLIGRYSHGKTQLLNRIFSLTGDSVLPTGEGQVTAKVTRVEFADEISSLEAFCFTEGGEEEQRIDPTVLRQQVKDGSDPAAKSMIHGYVYRIPTDKDLSKLFSKNKIALIDTPGLGGAFQNDEVMTQEYIPFLDMVLLCVRVDQIDKAAMELNDYISKFNCPIIPIITFWDLVENSSDYTKLDPVLDHCDGPEQVFRAVKDKMIVALPGLKGLASDMIAVSAVSGYGIDNVCQRVVGKIAKKELLVRTKKKEVSSIFQRKLEESNSTLKNYETSLVNANAQLKKELEASIPPGNETSISIQETLKRLPSRLRRVKTFVGRCLRAAKADFSDGVRKVDSMSKMSDLSVFPSEFESWVNEVKIPELTTEILEQYRIDVEEYIKTEVDRVIKGVEIREKRELISEINDMFSRNGDSDSVDIPRYKCPNIVGDWIKSLQISFIKLLPQVFSNPQMYILLVIGAALIILSGTNVFGLGLGDLGKLLKVLGIIALGVAGFMVYPAYKTVREGELVSLTKRIRQKLEASVEQIDFKARYSEMIDSITNERIEELQEILDDYASEWVKDVKSIQRLQDTMEDSVADVKKVVDDALTEIKAEGV